jgi:hypothetical protein
VYVPDLSPKLHPYFERYFGRLSQLFNQGEKENKG